MTHLSQTAGLASHEPEATRQSWLLMHRKIQVAPGWEQRQAWAAGRDREVVPQPEEWFRQLVMGLAQDRVWSAGRD